VKYYDLFDFTCALRKMIFSQNKTKSENVILDCRKIAGLTVMGSVVIQVYAGECTPRSGLRVEASCYVPCQRSNKRTCRLNPHYPFNAELETGNLWISFNFL